MNREKRMKKILEEINGTFTTPGQKVLAGALIAVAILALILFLTSCREVMNTYQDLTI
jgi:hypothetical protein